MGFVYRAYHAIAPMSTKKGLSTHASYGFIRSMLKLLKDFSPENLVAVFDGPNNKKSRLEIYPEYKANRPPPPVDMKQQIEWSKEICKLLGLPLICLSGVEADDTIATATKFWTKNGGDVVICSSDKDLCQLVSDKVRILNVHKNNLLITPEIVEEIYGIPPHQILDYLSLVGDASDNIPGLRGFGPKTVISLLQKFGSLDYILEHPEDVPGKKKQETIQNDSDIARLSRKLATLDEQVEIPKDFESYQIKERQIAPLNELLEELEFYSLIRDLDLSKKQIETSYKTINSTESLNKLKDDLLKENEVCIDTETTNIHPLKGDLVGISFSKKSGEAYYVPFNGDIKHSQLKEILAPLFSSNIAWIGHNIKYDLLVLRKANLPLNKVGFDTALASYVLEAHSHRHSLDDLSLKYFGKKKIAIKDLIGAGKKQITMAEVPIDKVGEYACEDADYTFRLKEVLSDLIQKQNLHDLYYKLELPLIPVLVDLEERGIFVEKEILETLSIEMKKLIATLEKEIHILAGEEFKVNSPKQLSEILFDKMGITPPKKTATGYSTNAGVLEMLKLHHPIAEKVLEYRQFEKLRSTYLDALPLEIHTETKRIHCSFSQITASTGRLSSQSPNLQNIPVRTEYGIKIREAFKPQNSSWLYLSCDYSQIELRILAHLSEDPNLLKAFENGEDIHTFTASEIFHVALSEVTKEMRYHAKAVNFGILYGQQAFGLARELKIGIPEASSFIDAYFKRYPNVQDFIEASKEAVRKLGYASTITGRKRQIPDINHKNGNLRSAAERLAVNSPIQGSAADIIKYAMLECFSFQEKNDLNGYCILQIHDELLFEIPEIEVNTWEKAVKTMMEGVFSLKIPLIVDLSIGKNWKEC